MNPGDIFGYCLSALAGSDRFWWLIWIAVEIALSLQPISEGMVFVEEASVRHPATRLDYSRAGNMLEIRKPNLLFPTASDSSKQLEHELSLSLSATTIQTHKNRDSYGNQNKPKQLESMPPVRLSVSVRLGFVQHTKSYLKAPH